MAMQALKWDEEIEMAVREVECICKKTNLSFVKNAIDRAAAITSNLYESHAQLDEKAIDEIVWSLSSILADAGESLSPVQGGGADDDSKHDRPRRLPAGYSSQRPANSTGDQDEAK